MTSRLKSVWFGWNETEQVEAKATLENISQSMALSPCPPLPADELEENLEALHLYARYRQTDRSERNCESQCLCHRDETSLHSTSCGINPLCLFVCDVLCLSVSQVITLASWWTRRWQPFPSTSWRTRCTGAALPTTSAWRSCRCLFASVSLCKLQHFPLVSRRVSAEASNHSNKLLFNRSIPNHSLRSC